MTFPLTRSNVLPWTGHVTEAIEPEIVTRPLLSGAP
jgi:hypothetical protein